MFGLTEKPVWIGIAIFTGVLLLTLAVKFYQVNSLRSELAEEQKKVILLSGAIEKQNKAVLDMKIDSDKRIASAREQLKSVRIVSNLREATIIDLKRELENMKLTCIEAVQKAKESL